MFKIYKYNITKHKNGGFLRYLLLTDVHQAKNDLLSLKKVLDPLNGVLFAGDGLEIVEEIFNQYSLLAVKGNMDKKITGNYSESMELQIGFLKVFLTHGHLFGVKEGLNQLMDYAVNKFDLVIFGHTHSFLEQKKGKTVFYNPGAFMNGFYGILTVLEEDFYIESYRIS